MPVDSRRVDAVLWDFGGVFTASPFGHIRDVGAEMGVSPERLVELVFGPYDEDTDHPWHRVERGEITLEVAGAAIARDAAAEGIEIDVWEVLMRMGDAGDGRDLIDPDVLASATRVKEDGLSTAVVTNNLAEVRDSWRSLVPVDDLFDVVVDSSEIGIRKPDPRIFEHALSALGECPPDRAVFLDDHAGNVNAARALGLHGIVVPDEGKVAAMAELADLTAAS